MAGMARLDAVAATGTESDQDTDTLVTISPIRFVERAGIPQPRRDRELRVPGIHSDGYDGRASGRGQGGGCEHDSVGADGKARGGGRYDAVPCHRPGGRLHHRTLLQR